jgi:hypothetical protein
MLCGHSLETVNNFEQGAPPHNFLHIEPCKFCGSAFSYLPACVRIQARLEIETEGPGSKGRNESLAISGALAFKSSQDGFCHL